MQGNPASAMHSQATVPPWPRLDIYPNLENTVFGSALTGEHWGLHRTRRTDHRDLLDRKECGIDYITTYVSLEGLSLS